MRWPRGPRGAWRLLPRRSLLAALFLFSLSSSFLYFVYVAPGIGKRRAGTRGGGAQAGARTHRLPLETLSNPRPAGPGAAASPVRGGPGPESPAAAPRCPELGSASSSPAVAAGGGGASPGLPGAPRGGRWGCGSPGRREVPAALPAASPRCRGRAAPVPAPNGGSEPAPACCPPRSLF